jgi:hypothetical protein
MSAFITWINIASIYVAVLALVYWRQDIMPTVVSKSAPRYIFSEERAVENLRYLAEKIGPRVVGSNNEKRTFEFLLAKIKEISNLAPNDVQVDIDVQHVDGHLKHHMRKYVIKYRAITNIVVRVRSKKPVPYRNESLLISSHYDTGHTSPGCHDDGASNVVMLETLANLLSSKPTLLHPVLFLFNGGEEITLCAAHGFVNKHPWASDISVFLNLEAAGTGGKVIVFQSTDAWVMRHYANVNKGAWGSVGGQDIFQSNIVPSDTDYRHFASANWSGIDTAFYRNGHTYHTKMETCDLLQPGSIQEMGDNTLRFVLHMSSLDDHYLNKSVTKSKLDRAVYFDIIGYYMVVVDSRTLLLINTAIIIISSAMLIDSIRNRSQSIAEALKSFTISFAIIGISWFMSILLSIACALLLWLIFDKRLTFFGMHPYYSLLLYGTPSLLGILLPLRVFCRNTTFINQRSIFNAIWFGWLTLLIIGTTFQVGISYIPMVIVSCLLLRSLIIGVSILKRALSVVIMLPGIIVMSFMTFATIDLFVPIMGRFGNKPADVIMSVLVSLLTCLLVSVIPALFHTVPKNLVDPKHKKSEQVQENDKVDIPLSLLFILFFITVGLLLLSISVLQPYQRLRPKRLLVQHVHEFVTNIENNLNMIANHQSIPNASYMVMASLDHIPESFMQQYIVQRYQYNRNMPLYALPTFGSPQNQTTGYSFNTTEYFSTSLSHFVPKVQLEYDREANQTHITIDETSKFIAPFFSREIRIYTTTKLNSTSLDPDIIPGEVKIGSNLYQYAWMSFIGILRDQKDLIQRFWVRTNSDEHFGGIVAIKFICTVVENQYYSSILNDTLSIMPEFVAPGPAMVSVSTIMLKQVGLTE